MDNIQVWNIENKISNENVINIINKNVNNSTKLLNLSNSSYNLLEKFVYDTAAFHFNNFNININTDECYVEFWCKNCFQTNNLHVDCDEYKKNKLIYEYPLLSCVTYFNENKCPTVITTVDLETYKYKEFKSQNEIFFSIPKCDKQITFDGKFFHGSAMLSDEYEILNNRYIIAINLWSKKPQNVDYYCDNEINYHYDKNYKICDIKKCDNELSVISVNNKIINYELYEDILYNKCKKVFYKFNELINNNKLINNNDFCCFKFVLDKNAEEKQLQLQLKNKYGDIMDDINEIMDEKTTLKYNRFLQRFHYEKVYTPDICRYIINESEKYAAVNGGWTRKRHDNYPTTDLPVEKIPSIFGLVLETLHTIVKKVKKSYGLQDNMAINIHDLFIVKYKDSEQNYLDIHLDGSFLSFNILLSNTSDFEGGGTYFDDGLITYSEQGDILIHSSKIKHAGLPITKGTRYLLVGFLNLDLTVEDILNNA
jgi:hypothetical protein